MTENKYSSLTKADLLKIALRKKAKATAAMTKEGIIKAILDAEPAAPQKAPAAKKPAAKKIVRVAKAPAAKVPAAKKAATKKSAAKAKPAPKASLTGERPRIKPGVTEAAPKPEPKPTPKPAPKTPMAPPATKSTQGKAVAVKPARVIPVTQAPAAPTVKKAPAVAQASAEPAGRAKAGKGKWEVGAGGKKFFTPDERRDYDLGGGAEESLPESPGQSSVVIMAKGPGAVHVYWEVAPERADEAKAVTGTHWSLLRWMVRIYDVTGEDYASESGLYYDFAVGSAAGSLYADLPRAEREYIAAIGLIDIGGKFLAIAHSNRVVTPAQELAGVESGVARLVTVGAVSVPGSLLGAGMGYQANIHGGLLSGIGKAGSGAEGQGMPIWLNAELTVYGGAAPGTTVILGSREIDVGPEGFFTAKILLHDGVTEIPVRAILREGGGVDTGITISSSVRAVK